MASSKKTARFRQHGTQPLVTRHMPGSSCGHGLDGLDLTAAEGTGPLASHITPAPACVRLGALAFKIGGACRHGHRCHLRVALYYTGPVLWARLYTSFISLVILHGNHYVQSKQGGRARGHANDATAHGQARRTSSRATAGLAEGGEAIKC